MIFRNDMHEEPNPLFAKSRLKLYYVSNQNLVSFAEVKHVTPFPEIIANFIGIVHELKPDLLNGDGGKNRPNLIAPCLMMSGNGNPRTGRIKSNFEQRYRINIVFGLFHQSSKVFSKKGVETLRKL